MSTYIVGDIHGNLQKLEKLLDKINFNSQDQLWLTGDLINGGLKSLETIRLIKSLANQAICVLGNHDLTLMACAHNNSLLTKILNENQKNPKAINGIVQVLNAPDFMELINWLEYRPLAHFDKNFNLLLIHAGVHPDWDVTKTLMLAHEVELTLQSSTAIQLYNNIYGDQPENWDDNLISIDRLRCIINYLTRIRFCTIDGKLNLHIKGTISDQPNGYLPWYTIEQRKTKDVTIVFGHWAALSGNVDYPNIIALDTGCRWNGPLTAYKIESKEFFNIK
jgi:bis(5'-nucleosyl)-tetraphosphatase (symmetrical)